MPDPDGWCDISGAGYETSMGVKPLWVTVVASPLWGFESRSWAINNVDCDVFGCLPCRGLSAPASSPCCIDDEIVRAELAGMHVSRAPSWPVENQLRDDSCSVVVAWAPSP